MSAIAEIVSRRFLLYQLAAREIKVRYKQSYLGIGWAVLQPLALMAVFSVIFTRVIPVEMKDYPYPVFCFAGLLVWDLFSRSVTLLTDAMVRNASLIQKVYFPREVLLVSGMAARLVDFSIAFVIYLGLMVVFRVPLTWYFLLALLMVAVVATLTLGVSLFSSALQVFRRDISPIMTLVVQVWFYATPVIYPLDRVPAQWRWVAWANPMTGAVEGFRDAVLRGRMPDMTLLGISVAWATALLVLGHLFFSHAEQQFADVI